MPSSTLRQRLAVAVTLAAGMGALGLWECAVYTPALLLDGGAPDAGSEADNGDADTCSHTHWPTRPAMDTPGGTAEYEFYNALTYLDFGGRDAGPIPTIGYDLDGVCTCPGPESCKLGTGEIGQQHCDFPGGIDNSGENLIVQFTTYPGFWDQGYINSHIAQGFYGALIRVRQYNGLADDIQVEVSLFTSNGTEGIQGGAPKPPKNDGTDKWTIDPGSLLGATIPDGGEPIPRDAVDVNAYVSGGYLVANLNVPLSVGAGNGDGLVTVDLTGSVIVAKLTPVSNSFRVDEGTMAGRWEARKLLTGIGVLHDPFNLAVNLCGNDPVYQQLKTIICKFPDVTANLQEDNKNAPCDSLSIAFAFRSEPATYGSVWGRPDAGATTCGPQWSDQCP